jgi:hypothetical protein
MPRLILLTGSATTPVTRRSAISGSRKCGYPSVPRPADAFGQYRSRHRRRLHQQGPHLWRVSIEARTGRLPLILRRPLRLQRPVHRPPGNPSCLASSLLEIFSVAYRWRICAQTSNVITFHNGQWPHFQLAFLALFSVGVNISRRSPYGEPVLCVVSEGGGDRAGASHEGGFGSAPCRDVSRLPGSQRPAVIGPTPASYCSPNGSC